MLLQCLAEFDRSAAGTEDTLDDAYQPRPVRWLVVLTTEGGVYFVSTSSGDEAPRDRGKTYTVPHLRVTSGVRPLLFVGSAEYVLQVPSPDRPDRCKARHAAFRNLAEACMAETQDEGAGRVLRALTAIGNGEVSVPAEIAASDIVAFQYDGELLTDRPRIRDFWSRCRSYLQQKKPDLGSVQAILDGLRSTPTAFVGTCLVCGGRGPIARVHPIAVRLPRPVADQQLSIVSANEEAFESYGLEQSFTAPVCPECATGYARGLNRLASDVSTHLVIGSVINIFWTREPVEDLPFGPLLGQADPEQVKALLESVFKGKEGGARSFEGKENRFYATALSGSGGRAVVREWIDTSVREAREHVARWFLLQRLVDATGTELGRPLALRQLAYATVRTGDRANPPAVNVSRALLRTALTGNPLPAELLYEAVRRNRAEQRVTRPRAALIKMVLLSQQLQFEEDEMTQLNPDHPSAAYHCGRLLAVLEQAQRAAIPGVNATIVDRFYGAASSAPCSVLPTLLRGARAHLDKLERDRPGAYIALERRLDGIVARIPELPATLSLADQGRFALGYYHQRAADRAAAREAAERRKAGVAVPEAELADVIEPQLTTQEEED